MFTYSFSFLFLLPDPEPAGVRREERGSGVFPDSLQAAHPAAHHRAMGAPPGGRQQRGDHPGLPLHGGRGGPAVRGPKRPGPRVLSACRLRNPGQVLVCSPGTDPSHPSLISLVVSVDVKHRVYFLPFRRGAGRLLHRFGPVVTRPSDRSSGPFND